MSALRTTKVEVGDHFLNVHESGTKSDAQPTLVFLHGSGPGVTAASNWTGLMTSLGASFHCVAPDVLGFGDSSHPDPAPHGVVEFTEARITSLFGLLDAMELGTVVLVGNSMGCVYALEMAERAPERIAKLVLMGAGNIEDQPTMPGMAKLATFYRSPSAEALEEMMSLFVYDPVSWSGQLKDIARDRLPLALREDIRRSHAATFAPAGRRFHTKEFLQNVRQPSLVIHGKDDRIVSWKAGEFISECLGNAHLVLLDRCGHWAQLEYPELFAGMLDGFVRTP